MKRTTIHLFFSVIAACLMLFTLWHGFKINQNQRLVSAIAEVPDTLDEYDPAAGGKTHPGVALKTANALSAGGEFEAAETLYVQVADQEQNSVLGQASRFNLANHYLRQGSRKDLPGAQKRPLIEIAKQRYRDLLMINPNDWDARINLEHALRLAPELPKKEHDKGPPIKSVNVIVPDFTLKDLP